jgi:hypothetical protein
MVLADLGFWSAFFLLLIFIPLVLIWGFALVDIFRRDDIGGVHKAIWLVVVIVLPFFGTIVYLLLRKPGATKEERDALADINSGFEQRYGGGPPAADQLKTLSDLHDAGKLSDAEFAAAKARLLGASTPVAAGAPVATSAPRAAGSLPPPGTA